jgi:hypothetical protein
MTLRKMLLGTSVASLLALTGSAYATDMSGYEHPGMKVHSMADMGAKPPAAPKMEMGVLVLAFAYARYCEPLQPQMLAAVNVAMEKLTPDQRWNIERSSYDNFELRQIGTNADPPSVRAGVDRMQKDACVRAKTQLGGMTIQPTTIQPRTMSTATIRTVALMDVYISSASTCLKLSNS